MTIVCDPIGVIHTPFQTSEGMPIQPTGAAGVQGTVEIYEKFAEGLQDIDGFSHLILLYHFHQSHGYKLQVVPFMDTCTRGLFATRAPRRPNPIGLSIVRLLRVEGRHLQVENIDVLDNTPLLDIKPYVPVFDAQEQVRSGWLENENRDVSHQRADCRFSDEDSGS
ncbi:MAG: tRNA (N6-threonylcarbamoyladenosine(37)-N6)-methyltransferase TrmO [Proteobacteria bacterium]|nr:tRNA (N6-threonylcarbamoyladenosine(37)-N6)-methyltransferase TrmO [Pseudomonadota bacterium]MBU1057768.1 tRNA (N6-threonylcarbamoyladenosine(37)-N6)-methyltransferase TrmO [Pseudomonadota bacterium]